MGLFNRVLVGVALLLSSVCHADTSEQLWQRYNALVGADQVIDSMPQQIDAMLAQQALTNPDRSLLDRIEPIVKGSWHSDHLRQVFIGHYRADLTDLQLQQLIAFRELPQNRRITEAELAASQPGFEAGLLRFLADLQENPPHQQRTQVIHDYIEATEMVDYLVELTADLVAVMITNMQNYMEPEAEVGPDLAEMREMMRTQLRPMMEQQMYLTSYYLYRDISDQDLSEYTQFYRSELGQHEVGVAKGAVAEMLMQWGQQLALDLAQDLQAQP
ncbi:hypothetical protein [Ferrimonas pelagia]|uniref:DUF2059 domain-containing protein n=1 Tax=Ferrimonas pelagia TaxID=1177826 RepID=A0ABP9EVS3_9GAMM